MRSLSTSLLFASCLGLSCAQPPDVPPAPTATPPAGTSAPPAPAGSVAPPAAVSGRWSSASCGARAYERRIALEADGAFTAEDRVSPCPAGTVCVWSGVVVRRGRYTVNAGSIALAVDGPGGGPGQPLPASLAVDAGGAPIELTGDGTRCAYQRM